MNQSRDRQLQGAIFDLDGVIVDTVPIHFKAWQQMFAEYGQTFTFKDYKEKVDGIPRIDGGKAILSTLSPQELTEATDKKQSYFLEYLKQDEIPVFTTTINLLKQLKNYHIKVAVISSSKNCPYILNKISLAQLLDSQISGHDINKGKPDPEIFLMAADKMGVASANCVVFEDATLGVEAAKRAGMLCVGIDRHKDPQRLAKADIIVNDLQEINYDMLISLMRRAS